MNSIEKNSNYTIGELASLAGLTVRTLRHYDQIGLLKPRRRDENGYRLYSINDLFDLQQILFFREQGFELKKIKLILEDPDLDLVSLLREHYNHLENQIKRLQTLQATIEKTVSKLQKGDTMPLTDKELYEGFSQEKIDRYKRKVQETYDPQVVANVDRNLRSLTKEQWQSIVNEGELIAKKLSALMDREVADVEVQEWIARQHAWIEHFFPAPADVFKGLGELYVTNDEFRTNYDRFTPGLVEFMNLAMIHYADTVLTGNNR